MLHIELQGMKEEDCLQLLKGIDGNTKQYSPEAKELVKLLGQMPLAIQQAVAYIEDNLIGDIDYTISDYIKEFNERRSVEDLLSFDGADSNAEYKITLTITWKLSYKRNCDKTENFRLLNLVLDLMSHLNEQSIGRQLIHKMLVKKDEKRYEKDFDKIMKSLKTLSIISFPGKGKISVHSMIQNLIRVTSSVSGIVQFLLIYFMENEIEVGFENADQFLSSDEYLHVLSIWGHVLKDNIQLDNDELAEAMSGWAELLQKIGKYSDCYEAFFRVSEYQKVTKGDKDEKYLTTMCRIIQSFWELGEYEKSISLGRKTAEIAESLPELGPENRLTIEIKHLIAESLDYFGKTQEVLLVNQEINQIAERALGHEDILTLQIKNNVALNLNYLGHYNEALVIFREVHESHKSCLGANHCDALNSKHNIGLTLWSLGQYEEALIIYDQVYESKKLALGENHPSTQMTKHNIGSCHFNLHQLDKALIIYSEVYETRKLVLGENHPQTVNTKHNGAFILKSLGKYDEALVMFREVLESKNRIFRESHASTQKTKNNIEDLLNRLGN